MTRRFSTHSTIAVLSAGLSFAGVYGSAPAEARSGSLGAEPFAELAALPERALEGQRGGVRIDGIDMDIAIRIETRINERLRMVSTLLTDANERISRRTEVLVDRLDQVTSVAPPAIDQSLEPPAPPTASTTLSAPPVAPRTASNSKPAPSQTRATTLPASATAVSASATPHGLTDGPALSVRHILQGGLGTRVVNRLNEQRIVNRIEMTVTFRNYEAIRQQAQRVRALSAALRTAAGGR